MTVFPQIFRIRQKLDTRHIEDMPAEVHAQLSRLSLDSRVKPGQSVAVTAGSRGLANYQLIVRAIAEFFQRLGAKPFVVPAMGSHAGGTAEGQQRLLESFGISESAVGCPIRSDMSTVVVGQTPQGVSVHFDRRAFAADHVLVFNRVKPHTMFSGPVQSGLIKMMLIGLGKHAGAAVYHPAIRLHGFEQIAQSAAGEIFAKCNILAGLAVVENSLEQTAVIKALHPEEFFSQEPLLLAEAERLMPRLPFDDVDLLLVDRIGKEISGTGMDTNVIGRKFNDHAAVADERTRVRRIAVRALSEATKGNALGIGIAEFCLARAVRAADFEITRLNTAASGHASAAEPPPACETDREMLAAAIADLHPPDPPAIKLLWIADTKNLAELECSAAYLSEAQARDDLKIISDLRPLPFDEWGNLPDCV